MKGFKEVLNSKRVVFASLIILLIIIIPSTIQIIKGTLVNKYYSTDACGYSGSAWGTVFKTCECSGVKLSKILLGGPSKSVCFGECSSCECWIYNSSFENVETVPC